MRRPSPPTRRRRPGRLSTTLTVLCAVVLVVAGVLTGMEIGSQRRRGDASEVKVGYERTGVYRLGVVTGRGGPHRVSDARHDGARTADQQRSADVGWDAACTAWQYYGVFGDDDAFECATASARPPVAYAGAGRGNSSALADALAFTDWHFPITGDLRVAATGALEIAADPGIPRSAGVTRVRVTVHEVGGIEQKAAAAVVADVDVLLVPSPNARAAARFVASEGGGPEVIGVDNLAQAIREVCQRSLTEVCRERVLPLE